MKRARYKTGLLAPAKWIGTVTGVSGAVLIALNLDVVAYGFGLFLISSVLWAWVAEMIMNTKRAKLLSHLSDVPCSKKILPVLNIHDAFWSKSFKLGPQDVVPEVARALQDLLVAAGPDGVLSLLPDGSLPARTRRNMNDLVRVWEATGHLLPVDLQMARRVLDADASDVFHGLSVAHDPGMPTLDPWRRAVIEKLNRDNGPPPADLVDTLCDALSQAPRAPETTSLGTLARDVAVKITENIAAQGRSMAKTSPK